MQLQQKSVLITGGAGFIGSNLAARLLDQGHEVTIFDNLSRPGSASTLGWLRSTFGETAFHFVEADLSDYQALCRAANGKQQIYHLAGQVAVTTSVKNPRADFSDNALGTFNVLEAARHEGDNPIFIYASTNKVYGSMEDVRVVEAPTRYIYADLPYGIPETRPLDFHSPYGCSKGAGDQYVRDYARIYGLRTVVVRQSCIYGSNQLGIEDQGWLAWIIVAALKGRAITIYGNGKQVRDVLFIDDLLDAYEAITRNIHVAAGQIYNIGGGPQHTISVWAELKTLVKELLGRDVPVSFAEPRPGDQLVYVSDIRKAAHQLEWSPIVAVTEGVHRLYRWISGNLDRFVHL